MRRAAQVEKPTGRLKERERGGKDRDAESDDEFDLGSAEEAEGGSAEESESGREGSSRKKETNPAKHGVDKAIKGKKTEDKLETTNSVESENRSEEANSVLMFDSETPNQLKAMRRKSQRMKSQHRDITS